MHIDGLFPLKQQQRHFAPRGQIKVTIGEPLQFPAGASEEQIARELQTAVANLR